AKQIACLKKTIQEFPEITWMPAIENGSGVIDEGESLVVGLKRLEQWHRELKKILYLSLTWNTENRLGGGNFTEVGLKPDGEVFLEKLAELGICIDFSHTSDPLAYDILNYIDKKNLKLQPIASHSNFRTQCDMKRNLPDELAKEIFKRGGVIGMNFVRKFVGDDFIPALRRHIEHGVSLGGEEQLCFGADFFCTTDVALKDLAPYFAEEYGNSSCYPKVLQELKLSESLSEGISSKNLYAFLSTR
ncbi:MAG TPA: membrane dipeptidase, partial [Rhabdochlamydiaceae bacterium]